LTSPRLPLRSRETASSPETKHDLASHSRLQQSAFVPARPGRPVSRDCRVVCRRVGRFARRVIGPGTLDPLAAVERVGSSTTCSSSGTRTAFSASCDLPGHFSSGPL
jgi:hypothetical protein